MSVKISVEDIPKTKQFRHMTNEEYSAGVAQMILDLYDLATKDGCIAAAWSLELLSELYPVKD